MCSAWRDLGGQGTLGLLRSRWSSGWYLPQPRTWTPTPQSTDDRGRARAEEQNVPDGGAASPHQGAPETPRQRGIFRQLSLSRLLPPAWCWFPHPEVMPWGPLELRQQPRTISGVGVGSHLHVLIYALYQISYNQNTLPLRRFLNIINLTIPPGMVVGALIRDTVDS